MNRKNLTAEEPLLLCEDAIEGARRQLPDESVDLILTDPPFGINGDGLHKHYNRDESYVIDGYSEVPLEDYPRFTHEWIAEAERVLRPGGSLYIVSGHTNLRDILDALHDGGLDPVNHIIWKYNFGVFTTRKYVTSHYHILYCVKPGARPTFNRFCRFGEAERDENGNSLLYADMEDVWIINREYHPGRVKNKNRLPKELVMKILQYSSNEGDVVCDFFLGSMATAKYAKAMNRRAVGFEINREAYEYHLPEVHQTQVGEERHQLKFVQLQTPENRGRHWSEAELDRLADRYRALHENLGTKKAAIETLCEEFGRGRFAILNALKRRGI